MSRIEKKFLPKFFISYKSTSNDDDDDQIVLFDNRSFIRLEESSTIAEQQQREKRVQKSRLNKLLLQFKLFHNNQNHTIYSNQNHCNQQNNKESVVVDNGDNPLRIDKNNDNDDDDNQIIDNHSREPPPLPSKSSSTKLSSTTTTKTLMMMANNDKSMIPDGNIDSIEQYSMFNRINRKLSNQDDKKMLHEMKIISNGSLSSTAINGNDHHHQNKNFINYLVKHSNETLSSIAAQFQTTPTQIKVS